MRVWGWLRPQAVIDSLRPCGVLETGRRRGLTVRWLRRSDSRRLPHLTLIVVGSVLIAACGTLDSSTATSVTGDLLAGEALFEGRCASCHGVKAAGSEKGPPLVDEVYWPSHHIDGTFQLAVLRGVPQHHWRFGSMPPQEGLSDQDIADIVAYVRQLQEEAGIR